MLGIKPKSELAQLEAKRATLLAEQGRRAAEATAAQAAELAGLQGEIEAVQRAEYEAKQQARKDAQAAVAQDFGETLKAIVACAGELRGLLAALEERRKQARELGVVLPNDMTGGLQRAVEGTFWNWDKYHPALTGAAPGPSRARQSVAGCEAQYRHISQLYEQRLRLVESWNGQRNGDAFRQQMGLLRDAAQALRVERGRLSGALLALGDEMTMEDRKRALELQDQDQEQVTLAL